MKSILFGVLFTVCLVSNSISQEADAPQQRANFGFRAGLNLGYLNSVFGPSDINTNETGFYLGSFVDIKIADKFNIQPELSYSLTEYSSDDKIGLLHLPVLAKYILDEKFVVYAGPEVQYLLKLGDSDLGEDYFTRVILGGDIGGAFEFTRNFYLEARYYFTFTKFFDFGPTTYKKISFLQIGLAYKFDY